MAVVAGIEQDTGSRRLAGSMFCQRWQVWLTGKEQCFTVRRTGATLHWVSSDGMSGTARAN